MIPKIIHYCWLSGDPFPEDIRRCIDSWHKYLPDYQFMLWDTHRFDVNSVKWVKEAFEAKKYAFAADYIRLYALYNYGGIYLDSDVMVYKSFNDLLSLPYFIGQDFVGAFEPAIIGAQPETPWLKRVMDYYNDKSFINKDGSMNIRNLPVVFFEQLFPYYSFVSIKSPDEFKRVENVFNLFPAKFFNGRNNIVPQRFTESYCSHLLSGLWSDEPRRTFSQLVLRPFLNCIYGINYHFLRKGVVHQFDPIYRQNH